MWSHELGGRWASPMTFEAIVHFEHVSVQGWGGRMLTKSEELVPNGLGSKSALS